MLKCIDAEKLQKALAALKDELDLDVLFHPDSIERKKVQEGFDLAVGVINSAIELVPLESIPVHPSEVLEVKFDGGTCRVNGEEEPFKGGIAKIAILEIRREEEL